MARKARVISGSGLYHVYFKGSCSIFRSSEDYDRFEALLEALSATLTVHAFGLSPREGHLFVETQQISADMKSLFTDYAIRFNKKYNREGPVFGSRYKSEPADISYAPGLARYVMKGKKRYGCSDFVRSLFGSQKEFSDFMKSPEPETYGAGCGINSAQVRLLIEQATDGAAFLSLSNEKRAAAVKFLSGCGISKTVMAKYFGVSRGTIINCLERERKAAEQKRREEIVIL